jgi:hypothetical protein
MFQQESPIWDDLPDVAESKITRRSANLRLDEASGQVRFLLRSESGELFGVYGRNAQQALSAAPLKLTLSADNPFPGESISLRQKAAASWYEGNRELPGIREVLVDERDALAKEPGSSAQV